MRRSRFSGLVAKFVRESKDLCEDGQTELPRPLEFYTSILKSAFDFIESDFERNTKMLQSEFVTFAENLMKFKS
jgi:hypothetical protein